MPRLKTLSILAGILAMLAFSATTANANYKSPQSQGEIKVLKSGHLADGGAKVTCPETEIVAQWHIQAKGQIKQQQKQTTSGPHLGIQIKKWGEKCLTELGGNKFATEVSPCDLQLQQTQIGHALGDVVTQCVLKIGGICELIVIPGMESSQESGQGINIGLAENEITNGKGKMTIKANDKEGGKGQRGEGGIFLSQVPGHTLCTVTTNEAGKFEEVELEAVGAEDA